MDLTTLNSLLDKTLILAAGKMNMSYIIAVVITGLSVVFLGLVILILFVWAFGKIFDRKKAAPVRTDNIAPVSTTPAAPKKPDEKNQDEIIAVIAAAVAAMGEAEGRSYRIKSVRRAKNNKSSRSEWSMAGIRNDTTPF